jgi:hypothetical protein
MTGVPPKIVEFHWRPSGFKPDTNNFRELLEKKPWIEID